MCVFVSTIVSNNFYTHSIMIFEMINIFTPVKKKNRKKTVRSAKKIALGKFAKAIEI